MLLVLIALGLGRLLITEIERLLGCERPQLFTARTEIGPLVVSVMTVIELVEEVPVQPLGSDHT